MNFQAWDSRVITINTVYYNVTLTRLNSQRCSTMCTISTADSTATYSRDDGCMSKRLHEVRTNEEAI